MRLSSSAARLYGASLLVLARRIGAAGTDFLNASQLLASLEDPSWFEQNIPLLDIPDSQIQGVYYYRWQTYREHLTYTSPQYSWLATEFLAPVAYAGPYDCINAAAGHHLREGRWLRDKSYGQSIVNFWTSGPGQFPKPADNTSNADSTSWSTEYSFWVASAVWWQYLVTGDSDFATSQLDNLVLQYNRWANHFDDTLGLYWQYPVWDGTEYSLASYASSDPYHGGDGYRPTINAYQYGDAMAIANIAALAGDASTTANFTNQASSLWSNTQKYLWDTDQQFFEHVARENNPNLTWLGAREIMGYIPWMFNMPPTSDNGTYSIAFAELQDPAGFSSPYGPLSAENRSAGFMEDAYTGCCHWDGPSWPFATAQTLAAAENLLNDYPATSAFTATDYQTLVSTYAATQYRNGTPYVAEAHDPYQDDWIYDTYDHSEDYNHSTFVDNIIAGLIGLRPQSDTSLVVNPLVPSSWDHFALENAAYHGHNVTVIWDSDGSHYGQGSGMKVFVDGTVAGSQDVVSKMTVQVGSAIQSTVSDLVNIAVNPLLTASGTQASSSFTSTSGGDNETHVIDGTVWRVGIPENTRWTTYDSPNSQDWIALDLRRSQAISNVVLYFYDDGMSVKVPTSYDLQYLSGSDWGSIPNQSASGVLASNSAIQITFPEVSTSQLRVVAPNQAGGVGWGLSEFQVWTAPVFFLQNINSGLLMGVQNESTTESALVQQYADNGSPDHFWEVTKLNSGWVQITNLNSGKLLAVQNNSTEDSADLVQESDTGADNQLWRVQDVSGNGQFLIRNKNSGLVAGVADESTSNRAQIAQFADSGTLDHLWAMLPSVPSTAS